MQNPRSLTLANQGRHQSAGNWAGIPLHEIGPQGSSPDSEQAVWPADGSAPFGRKVLGSSRAIRRYFVDWYKFSVPFTLVKRTGWLAKE